MGDNARVFSKIAKVASSENATTIDNICTKKCEDQWISIERKNGDYKLKRDKNPSKGADDPCFILILESPHRDEFSGSQRPQPANGMTGKKIQKYFMKTMAKQIENNTKCYVYLINAIQYQCTLGLTAKKRGSIKEEIFHAAWCSFGKADFQERLTELLNKDLNCYIINACTKDLKPQVSYLLKELSVNKKFDIHERHHPSSRGFTKEAEENYKAYKASKKTKETTKKKDKK